MCLKLQCCPNLFGPVLVTDKCPENCSLQTKTKYSESDALFCRSRRAAGERHREQALCSPTAYYYGKKRKLSKPAPGDESAEGDVAKPARRRKKRKAIFVQKKRRSTAVDYTPAGSPQVRQHSLSCRKCPTMHLELANATSGHLWSPSGQR